MDAQEIPDQGGNNGAEIFVDDGKKGFLIYGQDVSYQAPPGKAVQLRAKSLSLKETSAALKVLLHQGRKDLEELQETFLSTDRLPSRAGYFSICRVATTPA